MDNNFYPIWLILLSVYVDRLVHMQVCVFMLDIKKVAHLKHQSAPCTSPST